MISKFEGIYEFLSNFFMSPVLYEGLLFPSSEHAYQAAKTLIIAERLMILNCRTPGQAKRMASKKAKKITLRPGWDSIRFEVMLKIVRIKFQNKELAEKLMATAEHSLVEGNYWHDNFWGHCFCDNCKNYDKINNLGFILIIVRSELLKRKGELEYEERNKIYFEKGE